MADFLSNLIARSQGAGPTVQPRPVHRFELAAPLEEPTPERVADPEDLSGEAGEFEREGRRESLAPRPEEMISPQAAPRVLSLPSSAPPEERRRPPETLRSPVVERIESGRRPMAIIPAVPPETPPPAIQPRTAQASGERREPVGLAVPDRDRIERRPPSVDARPPPPIRPALAVAPTTPRRAVPEREVAPEPMDPSQVMPVRRRRAGKDTAAPPPPIVNVTIGRIEVRASRMADPPALASPKPQAPVMTLEEYLKRRSEGEST